MTRVIVSMAHMASREAMLQEAIDSLAKQTRRIDQLVVCYSKEPFHLDEGYGDRVPSVTGPEYMELRCVPNRGAARKYLSVLEENWGKDDCVIVLADDDLTYEPEAVETVVDSHQQLNGAVALMGWQTKGIWDRPPKYCSRYVRSQELVEPCRVMGLSCGFLTSFRPGQVSPAIFDSRLRRVGYADYNEETFLMAMFAWQDTPRYVAATSRSLLYVRSDFDRTYTSLWSDEQSALIHMRQVRLFRANRCRDRFGQLPGIPLSVPGKQLETS